jgi:hypothetical protein
MLIWVWGEASGVFGAGEIVSLPAGGFAGDAAGESSPAAATIAIRTASKPNRPRAWIRKNALLSKAIRSIGS